jgi:cytochrome P450
VREIPDGFSYLPDPHPILDAILADGPVQRIRLRGTEYWLVSSFDAVTSGLASPDVAINENEEEPGAEANLLVHSMLATDPPSHTRLRRSVSRVFTARRIARMRPRIQRITDDLIDAFAPAGRADLMTQFALPLPINVICELLGIPPADREEFGRLAIALVLPPADEALLARAAAASDELKRYFAGLIASKRAKPTDDLVSALATAPVEERLSDRDLCAMAAVLVLAGHETTANLIGNGTLMLLRHPGQLAALRDDPTLLPGAVEELARYAGPISLGVSRFTRAEISVAGRRIPAGEPVVFSVTAANRDPRHYDRPGELDVTRPPGPHLAFGHGIHYCLGAPLARMEAVIAFGTLLRRLPDLALAVPPGQVTWRAASTRGLAALPVSFSPPPGPPSAIAAGTGRSRPARP